MHFTSVLTNIFSLICLPLISFYTTSLQFLFLILFSVFSNFFINYKSQYESFSLCNVIYWNYLNKWSNAHPRIYLAKCRIIICSLILWFVLISWSTTIWIESNCVNDCQIFAPKTAKLSVSCRRLRGWLHSIHLWSTDGHLSARVSRQVHNQSGWLHPENCCRNFHLTVAGIVYLRCTVNCCSESSCPLALSTFRFF